MEAKHPIGKCPVCSTDLRVTEYTCPACATRIVTDLAACEFCGLDSDLLRFLRVFLAARGNIKVVERELGISYPTVRKRLDDLLAGLGLAESSTRTAGERLDVLERLSRGEISVADALDALGKEDRGSQPKA